MSTLPGKTVLITGANAGIGKDVARQLALRPEMARIYLACRDQDRATMAKAELEAATGRPIFDIVLMDVADLGSVRAGLAAINGSVDALEAEGVPSDLAGRPGSATLNTTGSQLEVSVPGPGILSRIGFRMMAGTLSLTRKGPVLEERLRKSGVQPGQTVLDYGCGPGCYTIPAATLVGPTGHLYALDIQPAAKAMVLRRAHAAGVTNVSVIVSDRATGLADDSVDLVLLYDAIAGIADRRGVLDELDRILRPDGTLSAWVEHGDPALTLPLITANSRFLLRERRGDILNFVRSPAGGA